MMSGYNQRPSAGMMLPRGTIDGSGNSGVINIELRV